ncbi:MAG: hypothetical protein PHS14_15070 [Elusimicrobia bacterium]|nr:hypothetical protein [Elusimicrobiota bacterium]
MTPRRLLFLFLALTLSLAVPAGHVRAEDEPAANDDAKPAAKPSKKKPAKKKTFDYDRSKYKSREPSQTSNYKFNEKGDPISAEAKKKASVKKKKRSEPPEIGSREGAEACGSEESCAEKKTEADAL